jgi:4-azaleucine resistance transporter AzlC
MKAATCESAAEMSRQHSSQPRHSYARDFQRGFLAVLPLWSGVVPFGVAFAILARAAGFSGIETQAFSLVVFSGAAQVAAVTLSAGGAGTLAIALTTLMLNLRHVLYSLSLSSRLTQRTRPPRPILAFFLTDEAYGLTIRDALDSGDGGRVSVGFLLGAALSLYGSFGTATLAGSLLGGFLPHPQRIGLDFIFPLTFLALLLPLVRSRRQVLVAALSGGAALLLSRVADGGVTVLVATVLAAGLGTLLDQLAQRGGAA